jgi:hypothetical protein
MKIHRPNPQILIIITSRLLGISLLIFLIAVFVGCYYYFVIEIGSIPEGAQPFDYILTRLSAKPYVWLIILVGPVLLLPTMYELLKIAAVGKQLSIDGVRRAILENQKLLARFDEVEHLQLWTTYDEADKKYNYSLIAVLGSGKEIQIYYSDNGNEIIAIADDVADIMKVKVINKH